MAEDHHSCCFNLVKERVDGKIILMSHLQHGIHKNVHELQNSAMVLKSMSKGKAKKKDVKRKKYAMISWSNQSNQFVGFSLTCLMDCLKEKIFLLTFTEKQK